MKHCIIVKFNSTLTEEEKAGLMPGIDELFGHTKEIEGIHKVTLRRNVINRPNRYDLVIEIDMEKEALPAYDSSCWHKQWKEEYGSLLESKAIIDLE